MIRRAVYPGSFNPPTIAHHDLSRAVCDQRGIDVVVWSLSVTTLGKEDVTRPSVEERFELLTEVVAGVEWLDVQLTQHQLLTDIADGFDLVVMGADKWEQINEIKWYGNDPAARDRAIASLPELAVAPRPPHSTPASHVLDFSEMGLVSSTAARAGAHHLMLPQARASGHWG